MKAMRSTRQRIRKAILLVMFLAFPIIMNFFSPYVIIDGASQGILNGSAVVFGLLFLSALVFGRAWCGWLCPVGEVQELTFPINNQRVNSRKMDWIKWAIWIPWLGLILWMLISAGGYHTVDLGLDTVGGISVAGSPDRPIYIPYIIYYFVLLLMVLPGVILGRRASCHSICWMAPFMILGRKLRNTLAWSSLRLQADADACTNCKTCTTQCPMSLDVNGMVQKEAMENAECILCGTCVDGCPAKAIRFRFASGK
jgi:ferredoxin-type protein NapH